MGKAREKIIFGVLILFLGTILSVASNKIFLINEKADIIWVQSRDDKLREYVDTKDRQVRKDFNAAIKELKDLNEKDHDKLEEYLIEILRRSRD